MKKSLRSLLAFLIAATVLCCIAMADTGPKPSASFTFTGMPDEDYYVTMLAEVDAYGPHRVHQPGGEIPGYVLEQGEQDPAYPAWQKFVDYKDPDGYYFLEDLFEQCHGDDEAGWRYFPPERFKLLLYFPESDTFLCSTVTERYAFDSVYRLDLSGKSPTEIAALTLTDPNGDPLPTGTVTLDKADGTHQQIVGFFGRLGITLVIVGLEIPQGQPAFVHRRRQSRHPVPAERLPAVLGRPGDQPRGHHLLVHPAGAGRHRH